MTDRTRNEKGSSQDIAGSAFILVGGFAAVSIVLFLSGQEPNERVEAFTWPVVALVELLGSSAALLFSLGLAGLGSALFLRTHSLAPWRPLAAITAAALGLALILGAVECGGALGAWLPGLLVGFAGRAIGAVLGLALAWLGWTLFTAAHAERLSPAETVQRLGLSARHESAAGVSPAEAALLVTEPRATSVRVEETRPVRVETLRPFPPTQEAPAAETRRKRVEGRAAPLSAAARPFPPPMVATPLARQAVAEDHAEDLQGSGGLEQATLPAIPPAPSWEQEADEPVGEPFRGESPELAPLEPEEADAPEEAEDLAAGLAEAFELEAALGGTPVAEEDGVAEDEESGDAVGDEVDSDEPSAPATPAASWEQVGLFDEEELEEPSEPVRPAKVELTPSFDFESAEPKRRAHEPEPAEDPFAVEAAAEPAPVVEPRRASPKAARAAEELAEAPASESHREADSLELQPVRASVAPRTPQPEPPAEARIVPEEGDEAFAQLVFEAGCAILEQKRVAVSMLERRFQVDFDKACRVLDELQEAGLIGPYIGGRTRDILLTREEWLAHAPHAS